MYLDGQEGSGCIAKAAERRRNGYRRNSFVVTFICPPPCSWLNSPPGSRVHLHMNLTGGQDIDRRSRVHAVPSGPGQPEVGYQMMGLTDISSTFPVRSIIAHISAPSDWIHVLVILRNDKTPRSLGMQSIVLVFSPASWSSHTMVSAGITSHI